MTAWKMKRRAGAIEEFQIETLHEEQQASLQCTLVVSGWIKDTVIFKGRNDSPFLQDDKDEQFKADWRHLQSSTEQYTLRCKAFRHIFSSTTNPFQMKASI